MSSWLKDGLASLRDYDLPQLGLGKAFSRHLPVPSLVKMGPTLNDPYDADNDIADGKDEDCRVQRSNKSLGNGNT